MLLKRSKMEQPQVLLEDAKHYHKYKHRTGWLVGRLVGWLVGWLNLLDTELSPKRYWQGTEIPVSVCVGGGGGGEGGRDREGSGQGGCRVRQFCHPDC